MKIILVLFAALFMGVLNQCSGSLLELAESLAASTAPAEPQVIEVDTALVARGVEVYLAAYCGVCHTLSAAQTRGTFGPNHDDAGRAAKQTILLDSYNGSATTPEDYLRESLLDPRAYYTAGFEATQHHMPAFTHLPAEDIDALVYMLMQQRGEQP
ncbi:MAG: hypothetical protein OHK0046_16190 [Anaerolineae bacterium]